MRRSIKVRLTGNTLMEQVLGQWKKILKHDPGNSEARRHYGDVAAEVVPRSGHGRRQDGRSCRCRRAGRSR